MDPWGWQQLGPWLEGRFDNAQVIGTVYARRAPMLAASAGLTWRG